MGHDVIYAINCHHDGSVLVRKILRNDRNMKHFHFMLFLFSMQVEEIFFLIVDIFLMTSLSGQ